MTKKVQIIRSYFPLMSTLDSIALSITISLEILTSVLRASLNKQSKPHFNKPAAF